MQFADYLEGLGIEVIVDRHVRLGQRLPAFMEQALERADYVLIVCTETYKAKADARSGGVGYETNIITADLYYSSSVAEEKYIPILRSGNWQESLPAYMAGKLGVDCTSGVIDERSMSDLLATFGITLPAKQTERNVIRTSTQTGKESNGWTTTGSGSKSRFTDIEIVGILLDEVTQPRMDGTRGSALYKVPFKLSQYPEHEWKLLFLQSWQYPPRFTTMHRPGIASVVGDVIILDGTTIEEVAQYHRDTLVLCVRSANIQYQDLLDERAREEEARERAKMEHIAKVADVARGISF